MLEEAPDFSYHKTGYLNLAISLDSPATTVQQVRSKLCCGELSYNLVVYSILEEWVARQKQDATLDALLAALYQSEWDTVAGSIMFIMFTFFRLSV